MPTFIWVFFTEYFPPREVLGRIEAGQINFSCSEIGFFLLGYRQGTRSILTSIQSFIAEVKLVFDFYSKPRIILVGRSQKDARRLIEAFDDRFDVRYVEEISDEFSRFSDAMIFDYVTEGIIKSLRAGTIPYLCLIGSENCSQARTQAGRVSSQGAGVSSLSPGDSLFRCLRHRLQKTLDFEREKVHGSGKQHGM